VTRQFAHGHNVNASHYKPRDERVPQIMPAETFDLRFSLRRIEPMPIIPQTVAHTIQKDCGITVTEPLRGA
jgi:hypothetical protein